MLHVVDVVEEDVATEGVVVENAVDVEDDEGVVVEDDVKVAAGGVGFDNVAATSIDDRCRCDTIAQYDRFGVVPRWRR
jgi:hypothetical protein